MPVVEPQSSGGGGQESRPLKPVPLPIGGEDHGGEGLYNAYTGSGRMVWCACHACQCVSFRPHTQSGKFWGNRVAWIVKPPTDVVRAAAAVVVQGFC